MDSNILVLISGWFIYFALHSILATKTIKRKVQKIISEKYYRIIYNIIAATLLMPILYMHYTLQTAPVFPKSTWTDFLGLVSAAYGVIIIRLAFKNYDLKEFLGLGSEPKRSKFVASGISRRVRHPLYLGLILLVVGFFLFSPLLENVVSAACIIIYVLIGIQFEEKKLVEEFGEEYEQYKNEVPMLIPRF